MTKKTMIGAIVFVLLLMALPARADSGVPPEVLARAQVMINKGQYGQAFEYLKPYEVTASENINYNYLYGISALDSGHPSEAVFAFQRVLVMEPNYSAARMELARAYFELGDLDGARAEFEALNEQEPPDLARTAIYNYLSAIRRQSMRQRPLFSYYFQAGLGYDSNANGSTDADIFLNFRLDERNVATSSGYYDVSLGANYTHPINDWYQTVLMVGVRHRRQPSADFVNLDRAHVGLGVRYNDNRLDMTTMLIGARSELGADGLWDGEFNNNDLGLQMNLRRKFFESYWSFLTNLRLARIEYDDSVGVQDVDQALLSLGFEWSENSGLYQRAGWVVVLGKEDALDSGSPYGRSQLGLRLHGSRKVKGNMWLLSQGGFIVSDYDGQFFGEDRNDELLHFVAALDWRPFVDPRWSVQPHISYYNNASDIELFEYDRVEAGVSFRWTSE